MGSFYSGFGGYKSFLGHCEDGIIYSGNGNSVPIGRYENGSIYNQFKEHVGSYGGGSVYDTFGTHIASYEGGSVYNKYLNAVVGKEQLGFYDGNPAEAAALVLLFLNSGNESKSTSGESQSRGAWTIGYAIGRVFGLILRALWFIYFNIFIMGFMVLYAGPTFYLSIGTMLLIFCFPPLGIMALIASIVMLVISLPYWKRVFTLKKKANLPRNVFGRIWAMWGLKGRLAYKDLEAAEERYLPR